MTSRRQSGITLIEMLVVMTIVGLLAAVAAPSVGSGVETVRLRSAGERLAATMRTARDRAVRTRHYMEVSIDPKSRAVEMRDLEAGSLQSWELPQNIQLKSAKRVAGVMYPDGGVQAMNVSLTNLRGRQVQVTMDPFTLFPIVQEVSQ
jgi:type II secretion system protein H